MAEEMQAKIAEQVRADSQSYARLTSLDTVNQLLSGVAADEPAINLADMQADKRFQDIRSVVASSGAVYLYSETYIAKNLAETLVQTEDARAKIALKVREDSKNLAKVTGVDTLGSLFPDMAPDLIRERVAELLEDDRYRDITSTVASTGGVYLFSETYITRSYADILVRAEVNDPCATIAATVRDDARIYPRATRIEFFENPIFGIDPEELETHLASTLERPEFGDIKLIGASTGARYLYSDSYMDEGYARSLIEWEEVDQFENQ